jgi:tRNA C32,U32 (ribose-2'-O)-methylase TrmJ
MVSSESSENLKQVFAKLEQILNQLKTSSQKERRALLRKLRELINQAEQISK